MYHFVLQRVDKTLERRASLLSALVHTRIFQNAHKDFSNLRFQNIVMRNVGQAFFIWAGNEAPRTDYAGYIRNLSFSGMTIESVATSYIGSGVPHAISGLRFDDVTMQVADLPEIPATRNPEAAMPDHWGGHWKCGGLRLHGIPVPFLRDVSITCGHAGFLPLEQEPDCTES